MNLDSDTIILYTLKSCSVAFRDLRDLVSGKSHFQVS